MSCASTPHHITSIFIPYTQGPPEMQGSIGAGLAVEPSARACTGEEGEIPTTTARRTLEILGWSGDPPIAVWDPLPPGAGYSVSASTSLAAGLALAQARSIPLYRVFRAAHVAEVLESTGLGDVLAISCGVGIVLRRRHGPPGMGEADCIPLPPGIGILSFNVGSRHTRELIKEASAYRDTAWRRLARILDEPSLEVFIEESQAFTLDIGAQKVFPRWRELHNTPGLIGYYFKKRVAVVLVEEDRLGDAASRLEALGVRARILQPARGPLCIGACT
ncbi:MAG: hypothetical protein F7B18_00850 [Desulfurococcales archaeon]|nr:hypothetical protein [Desulfurococcales archaeon]